MNNQTNNIVNLDSKLSLEKVYKIAGKEYKLRTTDEIEKAMNDFINIDVPIQIEEVKRKSEELESISKGELNSREIKDFANNELDILKDNAIKVLDVLLGENERLPQVNIY